MTDLSEIRSDGSFTIGSMTPYKSLTSGAIDSALPMLARAGRSVGSASCPRSRYRRRCLGPLRSEWNLDTDFVTMSSLTQQSHVDRPGCRSVRRYQRLGAESVITGHCRALRHRGDRPGSCIGVHEYALHRLDYPIGRSLVSPMLFGSLGFGLGAAMGASVAQPGRSVVCLLGDGGLTMSLPALITAAEYGLAVVFIVFDNACWGAEKVNQTYFNAGQHIGTFLKNPDLVSVAESLGCSAFRVSEEAALSDAVVSSLGIDGPSVIVVEVDPDSLPQPARKDALSVPEPGLFIE